MEKIIELINNFTENYYEFELKSALFDKDADFCHAEILYKDGVILDGESKKKVTDAMLEVLPKEVKYEFVFIKNYINDERIFDETKQFLTKNFPAVFFKLNSVKLQGDTFLIDLIIDELSFEHAKSKRIDKEIENYFISMYKNFKFQCNFVQGQTFEEDKTELLKQNYREDSVDIFENRKIEVSDLVPIVGDEIDEPASYIKDKTKEATGVVVCGNITAIKFKVIETKKSDKNKNTPDIKNNSQIQSETKENVQVEDKNIEENNEAKYEKKLYIFSLADFTGEMKCSFLSNKENQAKLEKLDEGSEIIVRGNLQNNKYSGELELRVRDISYCTVPKGLIEYIEWKKEKPFYEFVTPEKIVTFEQNDLLNFAEEKKIPAYLQNKTFVCYDFETTGLHYVNGDKIIEIGAVKIENGKITERFMSYVDPERPIPKESSEISGIVDSDVAGAPKDYQVLQDFYKWTRGAIIIGYNNINFDNIFLIGQGKKCRYNFDNETEDVYKFATKYVHGVKNYKLGTIAKALGVTLDNAHRAVYDALATAEVFLKIAETNEIC